MATDPQQEPTSPMHRFRLAAAPAALVLLITACGGGAVSEAAEPSDAGPSAATSEAPGSAAPSTAASEGGEEQVRVTLENFAFDPTELTIPAGTEVSFLNSDSAPHTVTEGVDGEAADSPIIDDEVAPNQATRFTFDEPGEYQITCLLHPSMNMTVVVEG